MSFRPTIAVYVEGQIADLGFYRNWEYVPLLARAAEIALQYADCRTAEAYRERRFGRQKVYYLLKPEAFENTQENLKFLESCTEFPLVVDLTARCIYVADHALTDPELRRLPRLGSRELPLSGLSIHTDFARLLRRCRIPFSCLNRRGEGLTSPPRPL